MNWLKGLKTYIVSFGMIIYGVASDVDLINTLNTPKAGTVAIVCGAIAALMRSITRTPPFNSSSNEDKDYNKSLSSSSSN